MSGQSPDEGRTHPPSKGCSEARHPAVSPFTPAGLMRRRGGRHDNRRPSRPWGSSGGVGRLAVLSYEAKWKAHSPLAAPRSQHRSSIPPRSAQGLIGRDEGGA